MNEKEKRIKEQRSIEATKKNLMGFSGKIGTVVRFLGEPIISQYTSGIDSFEIPNFYDPIGEEAEVKIPTASDEDYVEQPTGGIWADRDAVEKINIDREGWYFDGLNRGMHLTIKYDENEKSLLVHYRGYRVYLEEAGELSAYVPMKEWEEMIDTLFKVALLKRQKNTKQEKLNDIAQANKNKKSWLQTMKDRWGL